MQASELISKPQIQPTVLIFESELAAIEQETLAWPNLETGGDLYGYFTYAGWPVVQLVVNANADARRACATFYPDAEQTKSEGLRLIDTYGLQHVGHWHSHHRFSLTQPSGVDRATVVSAMAKCRLNTFLQVIANIRDEAGESLAIAHAFEYTADGGENCVSIPWLVLPGISPTRCSETGRRNVEPPKIRLFPHTVTWRQIRLGVQSSATAPTDVDSRLLQRLGEELRQLHVDGIEARGTRRGEQIHIDVNHYGRRFGVTLSDRFPDVAPEIRRLFDDAPSVLLEMEWSAEQRIAALILATAPVPPAHPLAREEERTEKKSKARRHWRPLRRTVVRFRHAARAASAKLRTGGESCLGG